MEAQEVNAKLDSVKGGAEQALIKVHELEVMYDQIVDALRSGTGYKVQEVRGKYLEQIEAIRTGLQKITGELSPVGYAQEGEGEKEAEGKEGEKEPERSPATQHLTNATPDPKEHAEELPPYTAGEKAATPRDKSGYADTTVPE